MVVVVAALAVVEFVSVVLATAKLEGQISGPQEKEALERQESDFA